MKRRLRSALPPLIFLSLTVYFLWNAVQGDRGLQAYAKRETLLVTAQADLRKAEAEREGWERRVAALRASHLDPDLLDERVRAMLNRSDQNDIIVPYGPKERLF
jgi:cell division protein FtsB